LHPFPPPSPPTSRFIPPPSLRIEQPPGVELISYSNLEGTHESTHEARRERGDKRRACLGGTWSIPGTGGGTHDDDGGFSPRESNRHQEKESAARKKWPPCVSDCFGFFNSWNSFLSCHGNSVVQVVPNFQRLAACRRRPSALRSFAGGHLPATGTERGYWGTGRGRPDL
jgi:hypothetical protein